MPLDPPKPPIRLLEAVDPNSEDLALLSPPEALSCPPLPLTPSLSPGRLLEAVDPNSEDLAISHYKLATFFYAHDLLQVWGSMETCKEVWRGLHMPLRHSCRRRRDLLFLSFTPPQQLA